MLFILNNNGVPSWQLSPPKHQFYSCANRDFHLAELGNDQRWDGGDHHRHGIPGRSDGEPRRDGRHGGDGGEQHVDHGHHSRRMPRPVNVMVTNSDTQSGTLTQGFTYTTHPIHHRR